MAVRSDGARVGATELRVWPWQRPKPEPAYRNGAAHDDADERKRDATHRAAVRDLEERTERVREFVDAVDLIAGAPPRETER